jgi:methionyl-tRNA synthetase
VSLPTTIFVHGYVTVNGEKISKSLGNVIDPVELAERYGTDALRYYLLRAIPSIEDGDFTLERFIRTYNVDLADQLGNLLNRVVSMISRYFGGVVPTPGAAEEIDHALARFAPHQALAAIWELVSAANKYVMEVEPWTLARLRSTQGEGGQAGARLATVLYNLAELLRLVAHYCSPFIPVSAEAIAHQLGITLDTSGDWSSIASWGRYQAGTAVQPGGILFPKLTME